MKTLIYTTLLLIPLLYSCSSWVAMNAGYEDDVYVSEYSTSEASDEEQPVSPSTTAESVLEDGANTDDYDYNEQADTSYVEEYASAGYEEYDYSNAGNYEDVEGNNITNNYYYGNSYYSKRLNGYYSYDPYYNDYNYYGYYDRYYDPFYYGYNNYYYDSYCYPYHSTRVYVYNGYSCNYGYRNAVIVPGPRFFNPYFGKYSERKYSSRYNTISSVNRPRYHRTSNTVAKERAVSRSESAKPAVSRTSVRGESSSARTSSTPAVRSGVSRETTTRSSSTQRTSTPVERTSTRQPATSTRTTTRSSSSVRTAPIPATRTSTRSSSSSNVSSRQQPPGSGTRSSTTTRQPTPSGRSTEARTRTTPSSTPSTSRPQSSTTRSSSRPSSSYSRPSSGSEQPRSSQSGSSYSGSQRSESSSYSRPSSSGSGSSSSSGRSSSSRTSSGRR